MNSLYFIALTNTLCLFRLPYFYGGISNDATDSSHRCRRRRGPPRVGQQSQLGAQPHAAHHGGRPLLRRERALPRRRPQRQPGPSQCKGLIFLKTVG